MERRASRIDDPIERLRFLRRTTCQNRKTKAHRRGKWRTAALVFAGLLITLVIGSVPTGSAETFAREQRLVVPVVESPPADSSAMPHVWSVEKSRTSELYSNGLRVDTTFAVSNRPRAEYPIFSLNGDSEGITKSSGPVGIVFHTTESLLAPFEEEENRRLKELGRSLLDVVRRERAYNYVIDRFGRVFRVVQESDAANHSGHSVWADAQGIYVNLNDSFLSISFEGQTDKTDDITPAQIASGRMLTEMLRSKYQIAAENCVTHAQVSVNPLNMKVGEHTDWASKFPFADLGLPDNYAIPPPAIYLFGFGYDSVFLQATGSRWRGLELADQKVAQQAAADGSGLLNYRATLQRRYKEIAAFLKNKGSAGGR